MNASETETFLNGAVKKAVILRNELPNTIDTGDTGS